MKLAVEEFHPAAASKIRRHWSSLQHQSYTKLESTDDHQALVSTMTEELYLSSTTPDTPLSARRFLASTLSLNRLYTGTGQTLDMDSYRDCSRSTAEFFVPNFLLSSIPQHQRIELPVDW